MLFCNTYHLILQPGPEAVAAAGGLHSFMGRRGPIMTDSGGFQVFSLRHGGVTQELAAGPSSLKSAVAPSRHRRSAPAGVVAVSEEGVQFRSYRDGSRLLLTPESSVAAQKQLGADIIIPLDELPPFHISSEGLAASLGRSHRWMARSLAAHLAAPGQQAMLGVVHGGTDLELRSQSAAFLSALPFDGFAVGGSLGRELADMEAVLAHTLPLLPTRRGGANLPVHLLGIGDEAGIRAGVALGVDTFDSSFPTKLARHGTLLSRAGRLNVKRAAFASDLRPPDQACACATCAHHSLAYLHHLERAHEPLLAALAAVHNLHYMSDLMAALRADILEGRL